uniref:Replication factor A C-terminal domain-containing protein n=1 Tax=Solanum tuberosum TaxID=4113 RepID=M1DVD5_SOLTU
MTWTAYMDANVLAASKDPKDLQQTPAQSRTAYLDANVHAASMDTKDLKQTPTQYRYKIHIKVKDNGGKTTLVLFNGVAEKLLDTSASKLVNRMSKGDTHVPSLIESRCGKDFVFKLKLTNFNFKEGLENYTVTKVFVPDEELELQHRINKEKKEKLKMEAMQNSHVQKAGGSHTNNSEENLDDGEGTSNGNTRVYARRLIKKRKHFIHLDGESDGDT